jgi:hypothetical protein
MIELTASLESGANVEHSSGHPVTAAASCPPTVDNNDWIRRETNEQTKDAQQVAVTPLSLNKIFTVSLLHNNGKSNASDENTSARVRSPSTSVEPADANGTKVFELMTANVNATVEYVLRLVIVTSAEFVESSSDHVRRQLGLMVEYTAAFGELSSQLMRSTLGTHGHACDEQRHSKFITEDRWSEEHKSIV